MVDWYSKIVDDPDDYSPVYEAIVYYTAQYDEACTELDALRGMRVLEVTTRIPGIVGYRYGQQSELDDIIGYLEIRELALIGQKRRHFLEHYNRKLTDRMIEKFAECETDVIALKELRNHVATVRNKFVALSKHIDCLHRQLYNITNLRCHGIEDAIL